VRELQAHLAAIGAHLGIVLKVETILWLAEASHTPKDGMPSRAEVTDAAMSERAECVMLNKGPYVLDAVRTLDDILKRMQGDTSTRRAPGCGSSVLHADFSTPSQDRFLRPICSSAT
jgi:hypothetical protein